NGAQPAPALTKFDRGTESAPEVDDRTSTNRPPTPIRVCLIVFLTIFSFVGKAQTTLTNGGYNDGVLPVNTTNTWTFAAKTGDYLELTCVPLTSFTPWIRLFGTNGIGLLANANPEECRIYYRATNSGTFTVLVSSYYEGGSGTYRLRLTQLP